MKRMKRKSFFMLMTFMIFMFALPLTANAKVALNKKSTSLNVGATCKLKVKGTSKKVKWASNKKSVATVSKKGIVTAKSAGTATIVAKVNGKKYKCKVYVVDPKNWTRADLSTIHQYAENALYYSDKAKTYSHYQSSYNLYISYAKANLTSALYLASSKYPVTTQDGQDLATYIQSSINQAVSCESFKSYDVIAGRIFYNTPLNASKLSVMIAKIKVYVSALQLTMTFY